MMATTTTTARMLKKPLLAMTHPHLPKTSSLSLRFLNSTSTRHRILLSPNRTPHQTKTTQPHPLFPHLSRRNFSQKKEIPNEERTDIVLTPGQKVAAGTRLTMYIAGFTAAITCLYFTARELLPTKMSPNSIKNAAHDVIANDANIAYRYGTPIKTYGKDHGGKREGRRNFIEHSEYTDSEDGSKRVRVRFNLEGPKAKAFVFAEVSKDMPSGEFVYLLVQDKRNGVVNTVIDNRSMLAAKRMAAGSKEGEEAFASLLAGGRK